MALLDERNVETLLLAGIVKVFSNVRPQFPTYRFKETLKKKNMKKHTNIKKQYQAIHLYCSTLASDVNTCNLPGHYHKGQLKPFMSGSTCLVLQFRDLIKQLLLPFGWQITHFFVNKNLSNDKN